MRDETKEILITALGIFAAILGFFCLSAVGTVGVVFIKNGAFVIGGLIIVVMFAFLSLALAIYTKWF